LAKERISAAQVVKIGAFVAACFEAVTLGAMFHENLAPFIYFGVYILGFASSRLLAKDNRAGECCEKRSARPPVSFFMRSLA
jgi:hypothetical protein